MLIFGPNVIGGGDPALPNEAALPAFFISKGGPSATGVELPTGE
jgi:hypothetical protein